jgi:hypothetical protein
MIIPTESKSLTSIKFKKDVILLSSRGSIAESIMVSSLDRTVVALLVTVT